MTCTVVTAAAGQASRDVVTGKDPDAQLFTIVARHRKKKRRGRDAIHDSTSPADLVERTMSDLHADSEWRQSVYDVVRDALATFARPIETILCLGLGSPTESVDARFQLCLLLDLIRQFLPPKTPVYAFDPVFTSRDTTLLTSLGVELLPENMHGKHMLAGPTLAFMPHCDRGLYENFFRANWCAARLANLLLIGNELNRYADSIASRVLKAESPCISRIAPLINSASLPEHIHFPNALSSIAVQVVRTTQRLRAEFGGRPSLQTCSANKTAKKKLREEGKLGDAGDGFGGHAIESLDGVPDSFWHLTSASAHSDSSKGDGDMDYAWAKAKNTPLRLLPNRSSENLSLALCLESLLLRDGISGDSLHAELHDVRRTKGT